MPPDGQVPHRSAGLVSKPGGGIPRQAADNAVRIIHRLLQELERGLADQSSNVCSVPPHSLVGIGERALNNGERPNIGRRGVNGLAADSRVGISDRALKKGECVHAKLAGCAQGIYADIRISVLSDTLEYRKHIWAKPGRNAYSLPAHARVSICQGALQDVECAWAKLTGFPDGIHADKRIAIFDCALQFMDRIFLHNISFLPLKAGAARLALIGDNARRGIQLSLFY
jgi:hypothetical protein